MRELPVVGILLLGWAAAIPVKGVTTIFRARKGLAGEIELQTTVLIDESDHVDSCWIRIGFGVISHVDSDC